MEYQEFDTQFYLDMHSEDEDVRDHAVRAYVRSLTTRTSAREFVARDGIEPWGCRDGTLWCRREDKGNLAWSFPRLVGRPGKLRSTTCNQVLLIQERGDWEMMVPSIVSGGCFSGVWAPIRSRTCEEWRAWWAAIRAERDRRPSTDEPEYEEDEE